MRQMVFANDDFDINAEVLFVSDNLEYASARLLCRGWPVGDLNIDDDVFEIAPVAVAGGFFTENAMLGGRASSVVGRASFAKTLIPAETGDRPATNDAVTLFPCPGKPRTRPNPTPRKIHGAIPLRPGRGMPL